MAMDDHASGGVSLPEDYRHAVVRLSFVIACWRFVVREGSNGRTGQSLAPPLADVLINAKLPNFADYTKFFLSDVEGASSIVASSSMRP